MVQDLSRGVLISGSSLVLQEVGREQAGDYTCFASNLEGDTTSDILNVQIRCKQGAKQGFLSGPVDNMVGLLNGLKYVAASPLNTIVVVEILN